MNITGMPSDALLQQGKLNQIKTQGDTPEALREAAEAFESVFMHMLLKNMRQANEAFSDENLLGGQNEKQFQSMMDTQLASDLSNSGGLGLADVMIRQLSRGVESR
ncbi:rod-binding protein [Endozoicomonas arenosclerae]|uniref:rod-binding protein n=1 Tax=Endozoicomonas arenosclerae TaxID=1633495 RepID=UPI000783DDBA|nr:rod-binding protein [Endozoicomonas arenosclerae]